MTLEPGEVKSGEVVRVFAAVAGNANGRLAAWRFLRHHYDDIYNMYPWPCPSCPVTDTGMGLT